ncbi:MAG: type II toxin-antitoxin system RelE/ParE family toxin [Spirochaetota bacterium]
MKYKVIVRPEVEDDLKEAFSWYEDKRIGLGYDFLLQVDAGINLINRNPEIHPIEYKGTRKHLVKRFPYKIIYLVEKEKIIILAVIHGKRRPGLIKKRIDSI